MESESQSISLRVYDAFAEVRKAVDASEGHASTFFHQEDYDYLVPDSIELEVLEGRVSIRLTKQRNNFEGEKIFIRNEKTGEHREAILIDDDESLVQDVASKRYYYAERKTLEFKSPPMKNIVKATFTVDCPTNQATLTYLDSRIKWRPKYRLDVDQATTSAAIKCIAVISNPGKHDYHVESAELFGGEISAPVAMPCRYDSINMRREAFFMSAPCPPSIDLTSQKEIGGLFQYKINKPFYLTARSDLHEEFLLANVALKMFSTLKTSWTDSSENLKFTRIYEISSDRFLPGGEMSIREEGRIIASTHLAHLPAESKRELRIGEDSCGFMTRKIVHVKDQGKMTITEIEAVIRNLRGKKWDYRYEEVASAHETECSYSVDKEDPAIKIQGNIIKITKVLDSEAQITFRFNITAVKK